MIQHHGNFYSW